MVVNMRKSSVTVLDIGSSRITCANAERGINNTFVMKGYMSRDYAGFFEGVFLDEAEFTDVVVFCIKQIEENIRGKVDTVYVGVPGEFTTVVLRDKQLALNKQRKITESDLAELYDSAFDLKTKRYSLINRSAIFFSLDDTRRIVNPVGATARVIKGHLSFVLCDNYFINTISPILKKAGVKNIEFVSSPLAEALYLFEPETRDRTSVLIDIGYISTSFSIVRGDSIIYQKGFAYGGGNIVAELTRQLDIDPDIAEKLKRKINLSCASRESGEYVVIDGDKEYCFPVARVNQIVFNSLDELCDNVGICLYDYDFELPEYVPLSVTGGGICFIRGAKEYLSNRLNVSVEKIAPQIPHMNKPTDSSLASLLDIALMQPVKKKGLFNK